MTNYNVPQDPAGFEEFLSDPRKVADLVQSGQFGDAVKQYASNVAKKDQDIATQVRDEVQKGMATFLKDSGQDPERIALGGKNSATSALYAKRAPGVQIDNDYEGVHDYFQTIWHNQYQDDKTRTRTQKLRNAAATYDPAGGGFLVPENIRSELLQVSLESSVVRGRAQVIPMETQRTGIPAVDSTSNVSSVFGGIVGYWTEEGGSATPSEPKFSQVVLDAKKLTIYTEVTNELLTDSGGSFEAFMNSNFGKALAFYEDDAFLNGTGAGMPKGVYNAEGKVAVTRAVTSHISSADLVSMYTRMLPGSLGNAVWVVSPDAVPELLNLTFGPSGAPVSPAVWLTGGQVIDAPTMTLFGRPVIVSEKAPKLGSAADIAFIDFSFYLVGDRQMMTATSSPHYKFQSDLTAFKVQERVDGRPWLQSAITPKNGSTNTLSAYVTLAA